MNLTKENNGEVSIKDLLLRLFAVFRFLKSRFLIIFACGILGALLGLAYSFYKKPVYTAVSTFVLEDGGKMGGLGQYAGLASLAGIDIGGSGSGIFQGDNIFQLYKSRSMIQKTLLSNATFDGKKQRLIDRFISFNKLSQAWKADKNIGSISFAGDPLKFNRKQDSIMTTIVDMINNGALDVSKFDKKLNIINVVVKTTDELFSKEFNLKLVENVNDFYAQTKTKKSNQNVRLLQKQADSVRMVLNNSIGNVAYATDASPNANPLLSSLRVPSQRKQIDVQANSAIYSEIVKNLEISKISLRQETPLIQIVDEPILPLVKTKFGKLKGLVLGGFLGGFICVAILLLRKAVKVILS